MYIGELKNVDEIYEYLLPYIDKIFDNYIDFSDKEKMKLSFKAIVNSSDKLDLPFNEFIEFYENELKILIQDHIKKTQNNLDADNLYIEELMKIPTLTYKEEKNLINEMLNGSKEAKEKLILGNLYYVAKIALKNKNKGIPLDDIIQAGSEGLIHAIDEFDITKVGDLSIYVSWKILESIQNLFREHFKSRSIASTKFLDVIKFIKVYNFLDKDLKTNTAIAINEVADKLNMPISYASELYRLWNNTVSLDEIVEMREDELVDVDETLEEVFEDILMSSSLENDIFNLFKKCNLTEKEKESLIYKFDLNHEGQKTSAQICKLLNITRQNLSLLKIRAFIKIRQSNYIERYAIYTKFPNKSLSNLEEFRKNIKGQRKAKLFK